MTRPSPKKGIDPVLEKAIAKLLKDVMADNGASLTDKCKAIDRSLKLEAIRLKVDNPDFGSGFNDD